MAAPSEDGGLSIHPMDQFQIEPLFGEHGIGALTITNQTLWMALTIVATCLLTIWGTSGRALVPTRMQSLAELFYSFVRQMVTTTMGEEGMKYFPHIFTLFAFCLFANLLGMVPWGFTVTSHIAITAVMAFAVFFWVIILGFINHGPAWLKFFWIEDAPMLLRPVLAVIEVISFFVRPVSHSVRLAGNMMAGHALLKVFAAFVPVLSIFGVIPLLAMVGVVALEFMVAVIQAYIFAILTCIYLNDALHPSH